MVSFLLKKLKFVIGLMITKYLLFHQFLIEILVTKYLMRVHTWTGSLENYYWTLCLTVASAIIQDIRSHGWSIDQSP